MLQHLFRNLEIGNDAVFHRPNGDDVAGRAAEHLFSIAADGLDLIRYLVDRDDRRLADDDAAALGINKRIGGSQIDREIAGK